MGRFARFLGRGNEGILGVSVGEERKKASVGNLLDGLIANHTGARAGIDIQAAISTGGTVHGLAQAAKEVGGAIGSGVKGSLVKRTNPTFYNGYTGLKPGHAANAIGWGAAAGYVGLSAVKIQNESSAGTIEYEGQAPIMTADGMGSSTKAPTLGADGSMVFGLNAMRRGR